MRLDGDTTRLTGFVKGTQKGITASVFLVLFTLYAMFAAVMNIALPLPLGLIFLAPFSLLIFFVAPSLPAIPRKIVWRTLMIAIALMPAWPVYLHLKFGPLPILTPTRLMFYVVSAFWFYEMACVRQRRLQFYAAARRLWFLFFCIAGLFGLKLLSVPLAEGSSIAAKETVRHIIIWLVPFFVTITYVRTRKQMDQIFTVLLWSSSIVAVIGIIEFFTQTAMAEIFSPLIGHAEWLQTALEEKSRDGTFRSQAVHTHPLSMGEHLAMMIPIAMYKVFRPTHKKMRIAYAVLLLLLIVAALTANSRGALIGGALAFSGTAFLFTRAWLRKPQSLPFRPVAGMVMAAAIVLSPAFVAAGYKLTVGETGTKAARSSQSRIEQIEYAWPRILERPVLGYGTGRSTRILGYYGETLTVDNFYINLALDYGFPGPLFFIGSIIWMGWLGYRWGTKRPDDPYAYFYLSLAGVAVSFLLTRSILSITTNIELLMIIFAAVIGGAGALKRTPVKPNTSGLTDIARPGPDDTLRTPGGLKIEQHLKDLRETGAPWNRSRAGF